VKLPPSLIALLRLPSAAAAWEIRGDLLSLGLEPSCTACELLAELHGYLDRIETGAASQGHSEKASMMDIGSLGGVVASELAEAEDAAALARRLLAGAVTEGLAIMATRQHVKAWRGELDAVHREAAWYLYGELWNWASQRKPELDPGERRLLLDRLLAPVRDAEVASSRKQAILCSLFILLLIDSLAETDDAD
jgi:hypothetical protein